MLSAGYISCLLYAIFIRSSCGLMLSAGDCTFRTGGQLKVTGSDIYAGYVPGGEL